MFSWWCLLLSFSYLQRTKNAEDLFDRYSMLWMGHLNPSTSRLRGKRARSVAWKRLTFKTPACTNSLIDTTRLPNFQLFNLVAFLLLIVFLFIVFLFCDFVLFITYLLSHLFITSFKSIFVWYSPLFKSTEHRVWCIKRYYAVDKYAN